MQPAFVGRPVGDEKGRFVALDLGGTNVRATVVEVGPRGAIDVLAHDSVRLTSTTGSAADLFNPIAEFIGGVLEAGVDYNLGFIFAFPVVQLGIRSGLLSKWTKEFAFEGVEGREVVSLLEEAISAKSGRFPSLRRLTVSAMTNDTVGVLAAGAFFDDRCDMGLIVGTGTNMAVALPATGSGDTPTGSAGILPAQGLGGAASDMPAATGSAGILPARGLGGAASDMPAATGSAGILPAWAAGSGVPGRTNEMLINMECGNFDGVRAIQTPLDRRLDAESGSEGQLIEKMIAGRYLGELVRLSVAEESERRTAYETWLRDGSAFKTPYAFTTELMSDVVSDESPDLLATSMLLTRLGIAETTRADRRRLKDACAAAARRSAHLVALKIAATATFIDPDLDEEHIVAADGGVIQGCPGYQSEVGSGLHDILGPKATRIRIAYIRDGSALGAAIIAATAAGV